MYTRARTWPSLLISTLYSTEVNSEDEEVVYVTTIFARGATVPWIN